MDHQRHHHGLLNLCSVLSPNNQCIVCKQVFRDKTVAQRHLTAALARGECSTGRARTQREVQPPTSLTCKVCRHECSSLEGLQAHLVQHLPFKPKEGRPRRAGKHGGGGAGHPEL
eukprot:7489030-Lingulodinium_polyedra.AAC.1